LYFALGSFELKVAVSKVEIGCLDFSESGNRLLAVECCGLISGGSSYLDLCCSGGLVDRDFQLRSSRGDPLAETGKKRRAGGSGVSPKREGGKKLKASGFFELKGSPHSCLRSEEVGTLCEDRGACPGGKRRRGDGGQMEGGQRKGTSPAESLELQEREASQTV